MIKKVLLGILAFLLVSAFGLHYYFISAAQSAIKLARATESAQVLGNPSGSLTVVEFVDYKCPYCPTLDRVLERALETDRDVRILLRPVTWIDQDSGRIAGLVFGAAEQQKSGALHTAIMNEPVPPSYAHAREIAEKLGIDLAKAEARGQQKDIQDIFAKNALYARDMGFRGIPSLLIGHRPFMPGRDAIPTVNGLLIMFDEARKATPPDNPPPQNKGAAPN